MKKILYFLSFAALLLVGCQREVPGGDVDVPVPQKKMEFRQVPVNFAEGDGVDTKSIVSIDAEGFKKAYILVFDASSKQIIMRSDGVTPMVYYTDIKQFECELPINYPVDIFTVVNYPESLESVLEGFAAVSDPSSLTESDLLYVPGVSEGLVYSCESGVAFYDMNDVGMPMAGVRPNDTVGEELTLTVKRLYAKYEISLNVDTFTEQGFDVSAAHLFAGKSNTEVPFFYREEDFPNGFKQTDYTKLKQIDRATEDDLITLDKFDKNEKVILYVLENCQGSIAFDPAPQSWREVEKNIPSAQRKYMSYVDIGLNYASESTGEDYTGSRRLFFSSKNDFTNDFNVIRNSYKKINLTLKPDDFRVDGGAIADEFDGVVFDAPETIYVASGETFLLEFESKTQNVNLILPDAISQDAFEFYNDGESNDIGHYPDLGCSGYMNLTVSSDAVQGSSYVIQITDGIHSDYRTVVVDDTKSPLGGISVLSEAEYIGQWSQIKYDDRIFDESLLGNEDYSFNHISTSLRVERLVNGQWTFQAPQGIAYFSFFSSSANSYNSSGSTDHFGLYRSHIYHDAGNNILNIYPYASGIVSKGGVCEVYPIRYTFTISYSGDAYGEGGTVLRQKKFVFTVKPTPVFGLKTPTYTYRSMIKGGTCNATFAEEFYGDVTSYTDSRHCKLSEDFEVALFDVETGEVVDKSIFYNWGGSLQTGEYTSRMNLSCEPFYRLYYDNNYDKSTPYRNLIFVKAGVYYELNDESDIFDIRSSYTAGENGFYLWDPGNDDLDFAPSRFSIRVPRKTSSVNSGNDWDIDFYSDFFPGTVNLSLKYTYYPESLVRLPEIKLYEVESGPGQNEISSMSPSSVVFTQSYVDVHPKMNYSLFIRVSGDDIDFNEDTPVVEVSEYDQDSEDYIVLSSTSQQASYDLVKVNSEGLYRIDIHPMDVTEGQVYQYRIFLENYYGSFPTAQKSFGVRVSSHRNTLNFGCDISSTNMLFEDDPASTTPQYIPHLYLQAYSNYYQVKTSIDVVTRLYTYAHSSGFMCKSQTMQHSSKKTYHLNDVILGLDFTYFDTGSDCFGRWVYWDQNYYRVIQQEYANNHKDSFPPKATYYVEELIAYYCWGIPRYVSFDFQPKSISLSQKGYSVRSGQTLKYEDFFKQRRFGGLKLPYPYDLYGRPYNTTKVYTSASCDVPSSTAYIKVEGLIWDYYHIYDPDKLPLSCSGYYDWAGEVVLPFRMINFEITPAFIESGYDAHSINGSQLASNSYSGFVCYRWDGVTQTSTIQDF